MNRPLVHFSTTSLASSRKATTECHSTYSFSPNLLRVAMRKEAALSLAPKKAASAPRLPVRITRLLLKDFRCCCLDCLFSAFLVAALRVDFVDVLMCLSPVPRSRIDFMGWSAVRDTIGSQHITLRRIITCKSKSWESTSASHRFTWLG